MSNNSHLSSMVIIAWKLYFNKRITKKVALDDILTGVPFFSYYLQLLFVSNTLLGETSTAPDSPSHKDFVYMNSSIHLARKYGRIFARGHYLSQEAKMSEHIFAPNGGYRLFRNARRFENWGILARVGYEMIDSAELAIIISYPTSASGIIVLLKTPPKYRKLDYNKTKRPKKITHTLAIFVDHGIMAHIPWWVSQWKLSNCIVQWYSF